MGQVTHDDIKRVESAFEELRRSIEQRFGALTAENERKLEAFMQSCISGIDRHHSENRVRLQNLDTGVQKILRMMVAMGRESGELKAKTDSLASLEEKVDTVLLRLERIMGKEEGLAKAEGKFDRTEEKRSGLIKWAIGLVITAVAAVLKWWADHRAQ